MPSRGDTERYALLPTHELDGDSKGDVTDTNPDQGSLSPRWVRLCSFASVALAVFSIFIPSTLPVTSDPKPIFMSRTARLAYAATLPRPPMYIGLSRLNRTTALAALPEEIVCFPHVFSPVSRSDPERVWPTDGRERRTFNGIVSPGEAYVVIDGSTGTSMIMQLRVQDYGLERCAIAAILPSVSDSRLKGQNRTLILGSKHTRLDVWQLDSPGNVELDLTTLNWYTRPARSALITSIVAEEGKEVRTPEFDCGKSASLKTYEIACAEPLEENEECKIEFWQEQPEVLPRMAFVTVQMPSL